MRRVPQEAFLSTECVFRTVGAPLRYRMPQLSEKRRPVQKAQPGMPPTTRGWVEVAACHRMSIYEKSTLHLCKVLFGAENGARTRDLNLGKVALYQLSYFRNITPYLAVGITKVRSFF